MNGNKHDSDKAMYSLIPPETMRALADVLTFGAKKYSADNWKQVDNFNARYYSAMMRHVEAWRSGEKIDPESGLSHLTHAYACLTFLLWKDINET